MLQTVSREKLKIPAASFREKLDQVISVERFRNRALSGEDRTGGEITEEDMKVRLGRSIVFSLLTAMTLLASACKQSSKPQEASNQPAPKPVATVPNIKVSPPVQAKAAAPKPGPNANKKPDAETIGKEQAAIHLKGSPHERSFWTEQLDVDGSGNPVLVDEAWDNHDKVLYISNDRIFTCGNGQTATGSTLMAVYAKGNSRKRPVGSGWWASELKAGDCGVPREGLYGCRFDAAGNNSDCGEATVVENETDDVTIVPLPESGASQGGVSGQASSGTGSSPSNSPSPSSGGPNQ